MKAKKRVPPVGELRQSQVLTTFGPGAMVDLPNNAVVIGGLDHWHGDRERIYEDRLAARVSDQLGLDEVALYAPPIDPGDPFGPQKGITAFLFPTWFLGQIEETFVASDGREYRTRPLVPWKRLVKGGYLTPERKVAPVVPVRFVQACVKGHISDIDWYAFARNDFKTDRVGQLWLDEGGAGNDFSEIFVRCERTRRRRPLAEAMVKGARLLGSCPGRQPWLGPNVWEPCEHPNRLLVRSAVRERVYAGASGYGILLYTSSTGSEGTLGGLVDVGRKLEDHLRTALELGRLCSNDPICADHYHDPRSLAVGGKTRACLHGL